jgi:predicted dehydrogenase
MSDANRREFVKMAGVGIGAATLAASHLSAASAHNDITMAAIGCGGQGSGLARSFASRENVRLKYVCDVDQRRAGKLAEEIEKSTGSKPRTTPDLRQVLDERDIDAVTVATPDHWHAPAAILACDAGKHVYVEKPCSHNVREGRLLVEAAARNERIVQHGTQNRSNAKMAAAMQMLADGVIGTVLAAKAWNIQRRGNIGHETPSDPPPHVDYDGWVGPAEFMPYQANRFHYNWHWWYNFGTGDTGNDGVHEIDYARWGLGVDTHPSKIAAVGGKYFHDDDQQFPDTQMAIFEYPGDGSVGNRRQLIFEMRLWSTNYPYNVDSGAEFYGTQGRMFISKRGKFELLGERNKRIDMNLEPLPGMLHHHEDFLDAIRNARKSNADIEIGHLSASLCHLANIATRVGRSLNFDPRSEQITDDDEAQRLLSRNYRAEGHWAIPEGA